ncbi:MAG: NUDIX hydrolase [Candidatus Aenigmatarchaeota archaeon]
MRTEYLGTLKNYKGKMNFIIASGPVIIEKGKVLLDKHGKDEFWKFPGSSIKKNEGFEECAKKRVKAELGIDIKIIRPLKPMIIWRKNEVIILIHYLAKRIGKVKPGKYIREWKWIDINKLPKDVAPNIKPVLKELKF